VAKTKVEESRSTVRFQHDWIVVIECDRQVAEAARQLIWNHEALSHKDAIHVATAVKAQVVQLDTFDEQLIGLSGQIGSPPLLIGKPNLPRTVGVVWWEEEEAAEETEDEGLEEDS
jgi:hypothetical protein